MKKTVILLLFTILSGSTNAQSGWKIESLSLIPQMPSNIDTLLIDCLSYYTNSGGECQLDSSIIDLKGFNITINAYHPPYMATTQPCWTRDTISIGRALAPGKYTLYYNLRSPFNTYARDTMRFAIGASGIPTLKPNKEIAIYPNPARNTVVINTGTVFSYQVQLRDMLGRIVLKEAFIGQTTIDVAPFPRGVYFVELINRLDNSHENRKLILE